MICADSSIKQFIQNADKTDCQATRIFDGDIECVTSIGYDLRTRQFCHGKGLVSDACTLDPGESVFVSAEETIAFGVDVMGRVYLKNSRIRLGLSLDAPVYQPGHKTRIFFRVMNVSDDRITLQKGESLAMIIFEKLEKKPETLYEGTFSDEDTFRGLAGYSAAFKNQIETIGGRLNEVKDIEQRMYGTVSLLMTVFIGIFTLLNVNVSLAKEAAGAANFVLFNAGTLCALSALMAMTNEMMQKNDKRKIHWLWLIPAVCAIVACVGYRLLR